MTAAKLTVKPLTADRWPDLETIFKAKGCLVARRCWCVFYRRSGARGAPARDDAMWFGAKSMYDAAEFEEVARRKPHRPVVRLRPV